MTKALYPGTFDPITLGHIDIIERALNLFDEVTIAIAASETKVTIFSLEERIEQIESVFKDNKKVSVIGFSGLVVDLAKKEGVNILIRGLRAVSDFEYEFQLAGMNRQLNKKIETVFLMSDPDNQVISSKFVKEIAKLNGKIDNFVTKSTKKAIKEKYD